MLFEQDGSGKTTLWKAFGNFQNVWASCKMVLDVRESHFCFPPLQFSRAIRSIPKSLELLTCDRAPLILVSVLDKGSNLLAYAH